RRESGFQHVRILDVPGRQIERRVDPYAGQLPMCNFEYHALQIARRGGINELRIPAWGPFALLICPKQRRNLIEGRVHREAEFGARVERRSLRGSWRRLSTGGARCN